MGPAVAEEVADLAGVIAVTGTRGMAILAPTGELIAGYALDSVVSQPTWSRDGSALIATVTDPASDVSRLMLVDGVTLEASFVPALRRYFFYSWSDDGTLVAALGPGGVGVVLDLLDAGGGVVSEGSTSGTSVFVAWEPAGDDLLVHRDSQLFHLPDPGDPTTAVELGEPGTSFLPASWIPGTRQALYVEDGVLVRVDVDTGGRVDLGPVRGGASVSVHPEGTRAVMAQAGDPQDVEAGRVVEVDLGTGARTPISTAAGFWLEWSPAGDRLLFASSTEEAVVWNLWDGETVEAVGEWVPSRPFFDEYLLFSPQYTESPRLWSPDGKAIVYGAAIGGDIGAVVLPLDGRDPVSFVGIRSAFWSPASRSTPRT